MEPLEMICAQITERNTVSEDMVDGYEHGVGHGHGRPVLSTFGHDALVLGRKIKDPCPAGRLGALH